ncbi:MAG TPA: ATP-binding protein [Caulobacteraceae bacterium]|nr:ATP-binding protein [Caulobacteraceae bacterium]
MPAQSILLVDDSPVELMLTGDALEQAFPEVEVRSELNSARLEAICEAQDFDCVIIDYKMPGLDGLACAQLLREKYPFLPIILITGVGDEVLAAHAMQCGVTDYIPKSKITPSSLSTTVEHAIKSAAHLRIIEDQRRELESFAFALAHDFKQPIRQIRTFSGLLSEAIAEGNGGMVDKHLAFLTGAARRLGDLVDVMAEYTLLNKPPLIEDVDLNEVILAVRSSITPYLEDRKAQLVAEWLPTVRGNKTLMVQVAQNLIVNGLKYNTRQTPTLTVTHSASGDWCTVTFRDNGIGIERTYLNEIFKPLVRLHTNAEYAGTGLGLTLAKKATLAQSGTIWCESEPGVGSQFHVRLPLAAQDRPS